MTNRETFEHVTSSWLPEAKEYFPNPEDVILMLVGNKTDIEDRQVKTEEGQ